MKKNTGLECDLSPEQRIRIAERRALEADQRLFAKRCQLADLENAIRMIYRRALKRGDMPLARFTHEVLVTMDCSPETMRILDGD